LNLGDERIADDVGQLITGIWSHNTEAHATNPAESANVVAERRRRMELWEQLKAMGDDAFAPSLLNDLRVFYGGRGIWVHQDVTRAIGGNMNGVTVGLLHTGSAYADDLHHDGVIYHYPQTEVSGRDASEIEATKAAMWLHLPVFVVSYPHRKASTRHVHLGWVDGFDDAERWFLVSFGQEPSPADPVENTTFVATVQKNHRIRGC